MLVVSAVPGRRRLDQERAVVVQGRDELRGEESKADRGGDADCHHDPGIPLPPDEGRVKRAARHLTMRRSCSSFARASAARKDWAAAAWYLTIAESTWRDCDGVHIPEMTREP
jgi:hypothetical protein